MKFHAFASKHYKQVWIINSLVYNNIQIKQEQPMLIRLENHVIKKYKHTLVVNKVSNESNSLNQSSRSKNVRSQTPRRKTTKNLNYQKVQQPRNHCFCPSISLKQYKQRAKSLIGKYNKNDQDNQGHLLVSTSDHDKNSINLSRCETPKKTATKTLTTYLYEDQIDLKNSYSIKINDLQLLDQTKSMAKMSESARTQTSHSIMPIQQTQRSSIKKIRTLVSAKKQTLLKPSWLEPLIDFN